MNTPHQRTERLHSLDTLRAIMMMLGLVLHVLITYIGGEPSSGWPMRDPSTDSGFLDWLLSIIHNFRMPIFMLIAGFFAALLFYERSPSRMIKNRFNRLVLPFVVFVVLAGTTLVCFVTYHCCVRTTVIGQFLNGRKYSLKLSDISATKTATSKDRGFYRAGEVPELEAGR